MNKKQLIKMYTKNCVILFEAILLFCVIPAFYFWLARLIAIVPGQLTGIVLLMVGSWFAGAKTYSTSLKWISDKNIMESENENFNSGS